MIQGNMNNTSILLNGLTKQMERIMILNPSLSDFKY